MRESRGCFGALALVQRLRSTGLVRTPTQPSRECACGSGANWCRRRSLWDHGYCQRKLQQLPTPARRHTPGPEGQEAEAKGRRACVWRRHASRGKTAEDVVRKPGRSPAPASGRGVAGAEESPGEDDLVLGAVVLRWVIVAAGPHRARHGRPAQPRRPAPGHGGQPQPAHPLAPHHGIPVRPGAPQPQRGGAGRPGWHAHAHAGQPRLCGQGRARGAHLRRLMARIPPGHQRHRHRTGRRHCGGSARRRAFPGAQQLSHLRGLAHPLGHGRAAGHPRHLGRPPQRPRPHPGPGQHRCPHDRKPPAGGHLQAQCPPAPAPRARGHWQRGRRHRGRVGRWLDRGRQPRGPHPAGPAHGRRGRYPPGTGAGCAAGRPALAPPPPPPAAPGAAPEWRGAAVCPGAA